jgi:hypothetical protein
MRQIAEWAVPTAEQFQNEILPLGQPAVLRDVARDWPLVVAGKQDHHKCMEMLAAHATNAGVEILRSDPEEEGRFHYGRDGRSLNFVRGRASLPTFLAALREQGEAERPYAMVVQSLLAERLIPGFATAHSTPMVPASVEPRLWIGNAAKVATHQDPVDNVAVVAIGRRRFTLFPPSAEPNLYMGPTHPTPAGTAVSMVHVTAPDLERFPLFSSALDSAQEAELAAGDAIYIPRDWFHHVEALDRFNMLVNYWWSS